MPLPSVGSESPLVDRRKLVQGVAWTVPAITLATAAPAYAVSGGTGGGAPIYFTDFRNGCVDTDAAFARWWGEPHRQEVFVRIVNGTGGFAALKIDSITLGGAEIPLRYVIDSAGADLTPYSTWTIHPSVVGWIRLVFSSTSPLPAGTMVINYHWGTQVFPAVAPNSGTSSGSVSFSFSSCPPPSPVA